MAGLSRKSEMTVAEAVHSFTDTVEGLADLGLHRKVDRTVDALTAHVKMLNGLMNIGRGVIQVVSNVVVETGQYLDPEDKLVDALSELALRLESTLTTLTAKKGCIDRDSRLNESHCDLLHSSYEDLLVAIACVIEVNKDLQAAVITHDLAAEPRNGQRFSTVAELTAGIRH